MENHHAIKFGRPSISIRNFYGPSTNHGELLIYWRVAMGLWKFLVFNTVPCSKMGTGPFFTEGSATKNSPGEVADMMRLLEDTDGHGKFDGGGS